jgi:hypothetical protein
VCPPVSFSHRPGKLDEVAAVFFSRLASARDTVAAALAVPPSSLELSMGMSGLLQCPRRQLHLWRAGVPTESHGAGG